MKKGKCHTRLHKGQEKGPEDLRLQKDYVLSPPGFAVSMYTEDKMIGNSQHRFTKGKLGLAHLLTFCNGMALRTGVGQRAAST